jgi:hypothetical protein
MQVLSYGYKLPEDNDEGDTVFSALEDNITRVNGHSHDGSDSARLTVGTQTISSGSWSSSGTGYRQLVTVPNSQNFDDVGIQFRLSTGDVVYPTVEKVSATTYYVYTNDNTVDYTAVYTH